MLKTTLPACDDASFRRVFKALLPFEKQEKKKVINCFCLYPTLISHNFWFIFLSCFSRNQWSYSLLLVFQVIEHIDKVATVRKCSFISASSDIFGAKISGTFKKYVNFFLEKVCIVLFLLVPEMIMAFWKIYASIVSQAVRLFFTPRMSLTHNFCKFTHILPFLDWR